MPAPSGPRQIRTRTSPDLIRSGPWLLIAAMAARSVVNTRAGPSLREGAHRPFARRGQGLEVAEVEAPGVEHHLGDATGHEQPDGRVPHGSIGQDIDDPGHLPVDLAPVLDRRPPEPGGVSDGGE